MSDTTIYSFPAALGQRASNGELLDLARLRGAADPSIFDSNPPYFWNAEISSTRIDAYFTQMQPSTLRNFAEAAQNGISFQNSHNSRELGLGYSLTGTYIGMQANGISRVVADFYTISGIQLGTVSTDNFIKGVRSGLIRDVSVGFHGGQYICSICGRDMMKDWECTHYPGLEYEIIDASGVNSAALRRLCTAAIENAQLSEVSAVYDGATPSAMITRAIDATIDGRLNERQVLLLEQQYRMHLPEKRVQIQVPANTDIRLITSSTNAAATDTEHQSNDASAGDKATTEVVEQKDTEPMADVIDTDRTALIAERDDLVTQLRTIKAENERLAPLETELTTLRARVLELQPLADDGKAYRTHLVDTTLAEGVRAFGETFDQDTYRNLLNGVPIETVKRMQADWRKAGDQAFPGGRNTVDTVERSQKPADTNSSNQPDINKAFAG